MPKKATVSVEAKALEPNRRVAGTGKSQRYGSLVLSNQGCGSINHAGQCYCATPLPVFGSGRIVCMEISVLYWYGILRAEVQYIQCDRSYTCAVHDSGLRRGTIILNNVVHHSMER